MSLLKLFTRPSTEALLHAESIAEARPLPGLISIELTLAAKRPEPAQLVVQVGGAEAFRRPVELTEAPAHSRILLHGHLLPNGPAAVRVELRSRNDKVLAARDLTLQVRNEGDVARQVRESLVARKAPLIVDGAADSSLYDYADARLVAWFDDPPEAVEAHLAKLAAEGATPEEIKALRHFVSEGYMILPDLIEPEHLNRLNEALDDAVARGVEGYVWGESQRLHNLHADYPAIRELWFHPKVMRMLDMVFGVPAEPCQSLTYVFGSEQQYHQDTIHLTPFPAGRMCGVWSALEDVQPESGELVVFPKSHKSPRVYMQAAGAAKVVDNDWSEFGDKVVPLWTDIIETNGYKREVYRPKAGTVLIWHENLMHAGSPRRDRSKSRRSIVGHYFAQGSVVYYDSSGMPGLVTEREPA